MADAMEFPETFDEFVESYGFIDTEEVYTNGSQLISVFRVRQWLEHISEKTQMIDKSNFDIEQYKTDLQSAYDCGYNEALSENKGEWIESKERSGHWYCSVCGGIHTDPETGNRKEI
jgi:hypothetical protein